MGNNLGTLEICNDFIKILYLELLRQNETKVECAIITKKTTAINYDILRNHFKECSECLKTAKEFLLYFAGSDSASVSMKYIAKAILANFTK
jgi:hypothetical protein